MPQILSANEIRVIGCLMEKAKTTPDSYPLTLNALANACNQKSSRNPVMKLDQGLVQRTLRDLEEKKLVSVEENFRRGVEKYSHRFYTSSFNSHQFDSAQYAVICLLLLRGPQTPGELRARSGRLHEFADNSVVVQTLATLMESERDVLVVKLPRTPGRKDSEYMHLFAGDVDVDAHVEQATKERESTSSTSRSSSKELLTRVEALEQTVAQLKAQLERLNS